ncbi:hypothetical protein BPAE_0106g00070 [Botrytis paeoniae]|uniref:Uncharacterized protein n=1 Tax=Botrytis paeoniae TaxID=278948 RepID=A0A4Z1FII3_9HELO|nr:hypothetical protein BPAE_0106g00070 [Botrytis paeoniae]
MFARKIISSATPISRPAILLPKGSMYVRSPIRGTLASTSISREYHSGVNSELSPKVATEEKTAVKDAEGQKIERPTEVAGKKVDGNDGEKSEKKRKTIAEMDEELRAKMEGREGAAGVSYEGGKPVTDGFGRGVKSNIVLVCPEQDGTDDQEIENYYDGFCHVTTPTTYLLQSAEEKIRERTIGNDFVLERGVLHFWRVEGKKDLAHFVLRPLPRLDWGIGEDPKLGSYEGPLLALVEKRRPKNKGAKVMCVVEKATHILDELEEYMSTGLLWTALVQEHLVMEGTKILLVRGNPKNKKVKEDNSEENLNDTEIAAEFEKGLIKLDYAGLDIVPLEDDHPIFENYSRLLKMVFPDNSTLGNGCVLREHRYQRNLCIDFCKFSSDLVSE